MTEPDELWEQDTTEEAALEAGLTEDLEVRE